MRDLVRSASLLLGVIATSFAPALAQPGAHPGVDVSLGILGPELAYQGRTGAVGSGYVGMSMATTSCNPGTINVPWRQAMDPRHPFIAFMAVRELNGRLYQISDRSYVKHGFYALSSSQCFSCSYPSDGTWLGIRCSDTYSTGNNGSNYGLAPPDEIDPWTGVWTVNCSLFDRGFPTVPPPQDCDGAESLRFPPSGAGWRVRINDSELVGGGAYFYAAEYVIASWTQTSVGSNGQPCPQPNGSPLGLLNEPDANRGNNIASRPMNVSFAGNGTASFSDAGGQLQGTVLQRWIGASIDSNANGVADGRVYVAVKVTGPVNGVWHYEYAAHNRDNAGGIKSFRVPVCSSARVLNAGFHDTDVPLDASNDWTFAVNGGEIAWTSPSGNALRWNGLYNFWFDCDSGPATAAVTLHQDTVLRGGAASFTVPSQAPVGLYNMYLGAGCGIPTAPTLYAIGSPARATIGNATFGLRSAGNAASAACLLYGSAVNGTLSLPPCSLYLGPNLNAAVPMLGVNADLSGIATYPLAIPADAALEGSAINFQHIEAQAGGALLGVVDLSNGLRVRIGNSLAGCPQ